MTVSVCVGELLLCIECCWLDHHGSSPMGQFRLVLETIEANATFCVCVCVCVFFLSVLFRLAFAVAASARFHQINRIRQMEKKSYKLRNWMNFILFQMCLSNGQCGLGFAIWINCVWKVNTRLFVSSTLLLSPHILSIYLSTVSTHDGCCIDCECIDAFPKKIKKKIEEWNCTHHYRERGTKINCIRTQTHWKP